MKVAITIMAIIILFLIGMMVMFVKDLLAEKVKTAHLTEVNESHLKRLVEREVKSGDPESFMKGYRLAKGENWVETYGMGYVPEIIVQKSEWEWGIDYHLVFEDGTGFCRVYYDNNEENYMICDLFISPECRKDGYATRLLDKCDEIIGDKTAEVVYKEPWMKEWYEKRGYLTWSQGEKTE